MTARFLTPLLTGLLMGASLAHAAEPPAATAPEAQAGGDESGQQVVVSGDKLRRAEAVTTQSVATRNGRQIEESGAVTVDDVIGRMANVSTTYGLSIRGIPLYGPNGGDGKTATITIDGVSQDGFAQDISGLSIWDADDVEVLRGPQSTNQGRNALAGAVVMRTRNPTDTWDMRGRASVSSPNGRDVAVAGGGPLAGDVLTFRLSAEDQRNDGATDNLTLHDRRWDHDDRHTFRGKLMFRPAASDYQALLTLVDDGRGLGDSYIEGTLHPASDRVSLANVPSASFNRSRTAGLEQKLFAGGIDWTWMSSVGHHRWSRHSDYDESEENQGSSTAWHNDQQHAQELRGNFEHRLGAGKLRGVFGGYWSREAGQERFDFNVPVSYVLTIFGQCPDRASCDAAYPSDLIVRGDGTYTVVRNHALFAEFDYELGALTFTGGLRKDNESQDRAVVTATSGNTPTALAVVDLLHAGGVAAPDGTQHLSTKYSALLPKLGVSLRVNPQWTAGLSFQKGYRTGGVNYSYQRGSNAFGPEYTDNVDVSLKGVISDDLLLTFDAYRIDWRDQQVNVGANSLDNFIVNAGSSRLQGLEIELRGKAAATVELFGAVGFSRTRYADFVTPDGDFSGNQFARSPRENWSLGGTWKPGAWTINADVTHEGGVFSDAQNTPDLRNPAHTLLNAKASFAITPRVQAFASGANLTDATYTTYRFNNIPGRQAVQLGRPRTLTLGLEAKF